MIQTADKIVNYGLRDLGYYYVILDDCWSSGRNASNNNSLIADPEKFPRGMKAVADDMHTLGLGWGMYSSAGSLTVSFNPLLSVPFEYMRTLDSSVVSLVREMNRRLKAAISVSIPPELGGNANSALIVRWISRKLRIRRNRCSNLGLMGCRLPEIRQLLQRRPSRKPTHLAQSLRRHVQSTERNRPSNPLFPVQLGRRRTLELGLHNRKLMAHVRRRI